MKAASPHTAHHHSGQSQATWPVWFYNAELRIYLMRAPSRYEDPLPMMLLKVPGLHPILLLQLLQMVATQEEVLQAESSRR